MAAVKDAAKQRRRSTVEADGDDLHCRGDTAALAMSSALAAEIKVEVVGTARVPGGLTLRAPRITRMLTARTVHAHVLRNREQSLARAAQHRRVLPL